MRTCAAIERVLYGVLLIVSLFLSDKALYILFQTVLLYYVIVQILFATSLNGMDGAMHFKCEHQSNNDVSHLKRDGALCVIICYIIYVIVLSLLNTINLMTWHIYIFGALSILLLNNIFIYVHCPFHKTKCCCAQCTLNGWDYAILATGLLYVPTNDIIMQIIVYALFVLAVVYFIKWETLLHKYPERFVRNCSDCPKHCKTNKE